MKRWIIKTVKTMEEKERRCMDQKKWTIRNLEKRKKKGEGRTLVKQEGIDGILVTVGLCIIALLLCVVMKDSLTTFITNIVSSLSQSANNILSGVGK